MSLRFVKTADAPAARFWLQDDDGSLINFASGYTFSFKIGHPGSAAIFTKTSNITGAAGAGVEPTGTPNVVITWVAGDLALTAGNYVWQLTATSSGLDRVFQGGIQIQEAIT